MKKAYAILIMVLAVAISGCTTVDIDRQGAYERAVRDAVFAEECELMPLVEITPDSELTTWNEEGKVLMLSWNRHPERYIEGTSYTLENGEIWTFTDKEILVWYEENGEGVEDWVLRLEELIRPAYVTDITAQMDASALDGSALGTFEEWFEGNIIWSYFDSAYPWTRLGYTYDWDEAGDEYGLTEFIILPGSEVEIEWTITTEEFLSWLSEGGSNG